MRLPSLEIDSWCLHSAEAAHDTLPDSFAIPPYEERDGLVRGNAARLLFDIMVTDEQGQARSYQEIMWTIIAERVNGTYIGILDDQPGCLEPRTKNYLIFGAEIPFTPEHIIEIAYPPGDYSDWQLNLEPERRWPR